MPQVDLLTDRTALPHAASVWHCYDQVFGDGGDYATWRAELFERHARRDGYRLAVAIDDDQVVGFAWGYIGQRGQYWSDMVDAALPPEIADHWIGGHFEFVELAVLPEKRRNGLGQALHDTLLNGIAGLCLLSTSDDPGDPAVRLCAGSGWRKLGMLRPSVQVMGLDRT